MKVKIQGYARIYWDEPEGIWSFSHSLFVYPSLIEADNRDIDCKSAFLGICPIELEIEVTEPEALELLTPPSPREEHDALGEGVVDVEVDPVGANLDPFEPLSEGSVDELEAK